ncbi:MAG TPA: serine/threonine-protein kinase [Polyangia bacterium]|jgi:serine/threonine-protein kinase|nr:serine/threonine-protein kinase [Polyangia bacterium]
MAMSADMTDEMIGQTIGSYTLLSKLGEGGMGAVYLAEHQRIHRRAAIKLLLPQYSGDRESIRRFMIEARAASRIRHRGIVEVYDCDVHSDGRAYIVMELLEGVSLAEHISARGRLASDVALFATHMIANTLSAVHGSGIVHRDLKPDNVFLVPSGNPREPFAVKVLDFGVAKLFTGDSLQAAVTRTGQVMGSPSYMAPEQCRGSLRLDHRADIYSLGCILYEMVCGRPPFVQQGSGELLVAQIAEVPPAPSSLQPSIAPATERLIQRMLSKSVDRRPQTMREVEQEVAACRSAARVAMRRRHRRKLASVIGTVALMVAVPLTVASWRHAAARRARQAPVHAVAAPPPSPPAWLSPVEASVDRERKAPRSRGKKSRRVHEDPFDLMTFGSAAKLPAQSRR